MVPPSGCECDVFGFIGDICDRSPPELQQQAEGFLGLGCGGENCAVVFAQEFQ